MKKIIALTITLLVFTVSTGCGTPSRNMAASAPSAAPAAAAPEMMASDSAVAGMGGKGFTPETELQEYASGQAADEMPAPDGGIAGPAVNQVIDTRKIIKNVSMQLQTQAFDTSVEAIPEIAEAFDGFVQDSYVEGRDMYNERGMRSANFTLRIPAEKLESFVNSVGSEFHVISKSQNSQDITESYYDSKARLDALKIQEERLLEMLRQAAELEYLLQVEKELMNVRYEIESLTSSLNRMDNYVSMSTVTIYLQEVVKYVPVEDVPVTFGERILRAFSESWKSFGEFSQDFAVWFVAAFPFLLLLAAVALVTILVMRKSFRRNKAKRKGTLNVAEAPAQPEPKEHPPTEEEKE